MRVFLALTMCLVLGVAERSVAQADISLWTRVTDGQTAVFPWINYTKGKLMVDARYNFDESNTLGVFVGSPVTKGSFTITPSLGLMTGDYHATSPQLYVSYSKGRAYVFMMNQFAAGRGYDFAYHWVNALVQVAPGIQLGVDEQVYKDTQSAHSAIDIGPIARFTAKKYYLQIWHSFSPRGDPAKTFIGLGTVIP